MCCFPRRFAPARGRMFQWGGSFILCRVPHERWWHTLFSNLDNPFIVDREEGDPMLDGKTYFLAGHARLPQGLAVRSMYDVLTMTVEADVNHHVILKASCTLATEHGREYIDQILRGCSLEDDIDHLTRRLTCYYRGKAQNAIVAALKDLHKQFLLQKEINKKENA